MTFQESIVTCLKKYATFQGRATRSEYWWFYLFVTLVTIGCQLISEALGGVASLALLLPQLAACSRRLHYIGKSAWWLLLYLTIIGILVVFIFTLLDTKREDNQYGPNPFKDQTDQSSQPNT